MRNYSGEETKGLETSPYARRVKMAYFLATPFLAILSIIRVTMRVDLKVTVASPGMLEAEKRQHSALVGAGTMLVRYYDDIQLVEAVESQFEGRDAGYMMPPMHDAFLRAAQAMAELPDVIDRFNKLGMHATLVHGEASDMTEPKNDNDSRSNA